MSNIEELVTINRYIPILLDNYPTPLNQTELAIIAGVSKAAITKVKEKLFLICELKTMAYKHKLVLKMDDDTITNLFFFYLTRDFSDWKNFFISNYFDSYLKQKIFYNEIKTQFKLNKFDLYFSEDDFNWVIQFLRKKLINYSPKTSESIRYFPIIDGNDMSKNLLVTKIINNSYDIVPFILDTDLSFLNKEDYIKLLEIRTKIYHYIKNEYGEISLKVISPLIEFLNIDKEKDKEKIIQGSSLIFPYLLKKIFKNFTQFIYDSAQKNKIVLEEKYKKDNIRYTLNKNTN